MPAQRQPQLPTARTALCVQRVQPNDVPLHVAKLSWQHRAVPSPGSLHQDRPRPHSTAATAQQRRSTALHHELRQIPALRVTKATKRSGDAALRGEDGGCTQCTSRSSCITAPLTGCPCSPRLRHSIWANTGSQSPLLPPAPPQCPTMFPCHPKCSTLWGWLLMPMVGAPGPAARLALHGDHCVGCTPVSSPRCPMSPWLQCLNLASLQPLCWEHSPHSQLFSWLSQGWGHGAGGEGSGTDPGRSRYCRAWPAARGPRRLSLRAAGPRTAASWSWPLARRSPSTGSTGTSPPRHRELQHSTRPSRRTWLPGLQPPCFPSSWHRGVLDIADPLCLGAPLAMIPWHSCTLPTFVPYQLQAGSSDATWLPAQLQLPCWVPSGVCTLCLLTLAPNHVHSLCVCAHYTSSAHLEAARDHAVPQAS